MSIRKAPGRTDAFSKRWGRFLHRERKNLMRYRRRFAASFGNAASDSLIVRTVNPKTRADIILCPLGVK
jgi:hypothetical protein